MPDIPASFPYKTLLITGGTGTFSHAMVTYLLAHYADITIRLLSRDEYKQEQMERTFGNSQLRFLLGDVRDLSRLHTACAGVDLCVHAAALKVIGKGEYDGEDFHKTNVLGTLNVMKACQMAGVQQAIFLSSDKASEAWNVYGLTKALASALWIQGNHYAPQGTRLAVVKYGNVMGSRGSVVEVWREAMNLGRSCLVTDPLMSRFWMTAQEAVALVVWTALHGLRGGIVVPHLPAFTLGDLRSAMQSEPNWQSIGRRPGEKLHELLMTDEEMARSYWYGPSDRTPVHYIIPPLSQRWGSSDERAFWTVPPTDMAYGMVPREHQVPYTSQTWPWRLTVDDLRQKLKDI